MVKLFVLSLVFFLPLSSFCQEYDFSKMNGEPVNAVIAANSTPMYFYCYSIFNKNENRVISSQEDNSTVEGALSSLYKDEFSNDGLSIECEYKVYNYLSLDTFCTIRYWIVDTEQKLSASFIKKNGKWNRDTDTKELEKWGLILNSLSFSDFLQTVNYNQFPDTPDLNTLRVQYHDSQNNFDPEVFAKFLEEKNSILMKYIKNK